MNFIIIVPTKQVYGVAVHELFVQDEAEIFSALLSLNELIWSSIQKGSVIIHCLAGMHR